MRMVKCKKCGKVYPINLSNCPDCFEKRRLPVGIVIGIVICSIVLGVCLVSLIGSITSDETPSETIDDYTNEESVIEYIEITASDIYAAYQENEIAADQKFKGKLVKITGIASTINSADVLTSANILLKTDNSLLGCVQCNFNSENAPDLANIQKGQAVTIIGTCNGLSFYNVLISACVLQ